jgi:hypothetical protein
VLSHATVITDIRPIHPSFTTFLFENVGTHVMVMKHANEKISLGGGGATFLYTYSALPLHAYIHLFNKNTQAAAARSSIRILSAERAAQGCVCYRIL